MAFAQLAEECRRTGEYAEAVRICQAGLPFHPDYLTARVTFGRALTELGRLDEAQIELQRVLAKAPDNLAANRAMAEIHQQRGDLTSALPYYRKALELAQYDPELESAVTRIEHVMSPPAKPQPAEQAPTSIEDLFDFDTLLSQLGGRTQPKPEDPPTPAAVMPLIPAMPVIDPLAGIELPADDTDPLALLERQLREIEEQRPYETPVNSEDRQHAQRVLSELEDWLVAIVSDRDQASA
jgi:tetratricopeptide (TPR) repeat protein